MITNIDLELVEQVVTIVCVGFCHVIGLMILIHCIKTGEFSDEIKSYPWEKKEKASKKKK